MRMNSEEREGRSQIPASARKTLHTPGRLTASSMLPGEDAAADTSVLLVAPTPQGKHIDRVNLSARAQAGQREMQKVYMENQLDLNESELQYYEEVVNELSNQLDAVRAEIDRVTVERDSLSEENGRLQDAVLELRDTLEVREVECDEQREQVRELKSLLDDAELRLESHRSAPSSGHGAVRVSQQPELLSTPDRVTNEFLGISSAQEDSDLDEGHPSAVSRRRDPSASFDSFHSTAEHVYHRNDSHELRRIIKEREEQVRYH
jgi:regulator of replication initiation timing